MSKVTGGGLREAVRIRGYKATPLTNTDAVSQDGAELRITGYELLGPRGNKTTVLADADGLYSASEIDLWCDGVDYASRKVAERKTERLARAFPR